MFIRCDSKTCVHSENEFAVYLRRIVFVEITCRNGRNYLPYRLFCAQIYYYSNHW